MTKMAYTTDSVVSFLDGLNRAFRYFNSMMEHEYNINRRIAASINHRQLLLQTPSVSILLGLHGIHSPHEELRMLPRIEADSRINPQYEAFRPASFAKAAEAA